MYFSATIFSMVGFKSPTLTSLSIALTNFGFTLLAFYLIDIIGRRRILLQSIPIMIVGLLLSAFAFHFIHLEPSAVSDSGSSYIPPVPYRVFPILVLAAMITYVAGYAIGMGNVPWQQSELFPLSVRGIGSGLSTATNWGSNFIIGITFLPLMDGIGASLTFVGYAIICAIGLFLVWLIYPETRGLSLEDVGGLLAHGYGVHESLKSFDDENEENRTA
jgi:MFS transporter, SP family, solute carrier family 2 (myo-inositol transporter), member 13